MGADSLIRIHRSRDQRYRFDFTQFDRWVELFLKAGFSFVEGSHFCDNGIRHVSILDENLGVTTNVPGPSHVEQIWDNPEYLEIIKAMIPALRDHLRQRGWDTIYRQHLYDEPNPTQVPHYVRLAQLVRSFWPQVMIIEAADSDPALFEFIDIIVPLEDKIQSNGLIPPERLGRKQRWTYTSNHPRGTYPNNYLDQPLIMTRVLFWLMWKYELQGFLYYALGYWEVQHTVKRTGFDPYTGEQRDTLVLYDPWIDSCQNATWQVPPGSWGFVYPPREPCSLDPRMLCPNLIENFTRVRQGLPSNKADEGLREQWKGPIEGVVGSIRWEQIREGIEDYGLLCLARDSIEQLRRSPDHMEAASKAANRLNAIVTSVATDWTHYSLNPRDIINARAALAGLIAESRRMLP